MKVRRLMGKFDATETTHTLLVTDKPLPCQELVAYYLQRVEAYDEGPHKLNSVIEVNPDARLIAERIDDLKAVGKSVGPLAGAPILLKESIETADSMLTTAGSLALHGEPARTEAALVTRLRDQGATLLGKTNLSEWSNFRSTSSISGWSSRGGQTKNPYDLSRSPNGSSSGSAAAVAADLCLGAIGTETDGSIVYPAAACGVVGFKPTKDLIPTAGIVPISVRQDHAGILSRDVNTTILIFKALTNQHTPASLNASKSNGLRVGLLSEYTPNNARHLWDDAIVLLERLGFRVSEAKPWPKYSDFSCDYWRLLKQEFHVDMNAYLQLRGGPIESLQELVEFNQAHAHTVLAKFDQDILQEALEPSCYPLLYEKLLQEMNQRLKINGIDASLEGHSVLAAITCPVAPELDCRVKDSLVGKSLASVPAFCGYPHITLPLGYIDGLPVNISLIARPYTDLHLLETAAYFERIHPVRTSPRGFIS